MGSEHSICSCELFTPNRALKLNLKDSTTSDTDCDDCDDKIVTNSSKLIKTTTTTKQSVTYVQQQQEQQKRDKISKKRKKKKKIKKKKKKKKKRASNKPFIVDSDDYIDIEEEQLILTNEQSDSHTTTTTTIPIMNNDYSIQTPKSTPIPILREYISLDFDNIIMARASSAPHTPHSIHTPHTIPQMYSPSSSHSHSRQLTVYSLPTLNNDYNHHNTSYSMDYRLYNNNNNNITKRNSMNWSIDRINIEQKAMQKELLFLKQFEDLRKSTQRGPNLRTDSNQKIELDSNWITIDDIDEDINNDIDTNCV